MRSFLFFLVRCMHLRGLFANVTHIHEWRSNGWMSNWVARRSTPVSETRLAMIRWLVRGSISSIKARTVWGTTGKTGWSLNVSGGIFFLIGQTAKHVAATMALFGSFCPYILSTKECLPVELEITVSPSTDVQSNTVNKNQEQQEPQSS